jgi:hypothetical protein
MFMADNYTDTTDTDFKGIAGGVTYNIESGKPLSAEGVRNALHTKENVANKVTSVPGLTSVSTDDQYPSAKVVYDFIQTNNAALAAKADDNNTVHKSGIETVTGVKTFGKTGEAAEPLLGVTKITDATNDGTKFATEAQVYKAVQGVDILPVGTILAMSTSSWTNADAAFRSKWQVCDGTGGTPDLRGRFLRGGTSSDAATGGADSQSFSIGTTNLPDHTHTVNDSGHSHGFKMVGVNQKEGAGTQCIDGTGDGRWPSTTVKTGISVTGGGKTIPDDISIDIVPSYYTVIYIIKVA